MVMVRAQVWVRIEVVKMVARFPKNYRRHEVWHDTMEEEQIPMLCILGISGFRDIRGFHGEEEGGQHHDANRSHLNGVTGFQ